MKGLFTHSRENFGQDQEQLKKRLLDEVKKGGYGQVEQLLRSGISADTADPANKNDSALIIAASQGDPLIVGLLLTHNANPNQTNDEKVTPLHAAALSYQPASVESLLAKKNINPEAKDCENRTPFFNIAVRNAINMGTKYKIMELLLRRKIDFHSRPEGQLAPIHSLALKGDMAALKLIYMASQTFKRPFDLDLNDLNETLQEPYRKACAIIRSFTETYSSKDGLLSGFFPKNRKIREIIGDYSFDSGSEVSLRF